MNPNNPNPINLTRNFDPEANTLPDSTRFWNLRARLNLNRKLSQPYFFENTYMDIFFVGKDKVSGVVVEMKPNNPNPINLTQNFDPIFDPEANT